MRFIESIALTGRWRTRFAVLLVLLAIAQTKHAYSDSTTLGVGEVNSCVSATALSDFKVSLEGMAATVTGRTEIQPELIQRHFAECTLEEAQDLLTKSGFNAEELDPKSNNSEMKKGTRRLVLAEKTIRPFSLRAASLNCRFILRINQAGTLAVQGFFYFDAP